MKSGVALVIFGVLVLSDASGQSYKQRNEFVGRVKAIRIDLLYLDENNQPDARGRHLSSLKSFDRRGNLTMSEDFYAYGKASYGRDTFSYDAAGRIVEKNHEINGFTYKTTYSYDDQGRLIREDRQSPANYVIRYFYDEQSRLKETRRSWSGTDDGRQVLSYDLNGRLVRRATYDARGSVSDEENRVYNPEGRLTSETDRYRTVMYDLRGRVIAEIRDHGKEVYEYNSNDLVMKREEYDDKGLLRTYLFEYEYDENGNWIEEVATEMHRTEGTRVWKEYRTLTYY